MNSARTSSAIAAWVHVSEITLREPGCASGMGILTGAGWGRGGDGADSTCGL
jgi:hypothetical protein